MQSNQTETKTYYYIDRKLISNDMGEVCEGLSQTENFLKTLQTDDIFNSLVMRLVDIFTNSKISYLKIRAARIMQKFPTRFETLPSREQIINNLIKSLKARDEFTRILTLETVAAIPKLFEKENSIYHSLLAKLRSHEQIEQKEKVRTIQCLCSLLNNSEHLSKLFGRNLHQLYNIGKIDRKILLFLSLSAKFEVHELPTILMNVWQICSPVQTKVIRAYLKKLIIQFSMKNYLVIETYQKNFKNDFPELKPVLLKIQFIYYPFLIGTDGFQLQKLSNEELLDFSYVQEEDLCGFKQMCESRLKQRIELQDISKQTLLLSYYVEESYDKELFRVIEKQSWANLSLMLKVSLVTANFQCANFFVNKLLNKVQKSYEGLIILKSYINFKLSPNESTLNIMCEIVENLTKKNKQENLLFLIDLWKKLYHHNSAEVMEPELNTCKVLCKEEISQALTFTNFQKSEVKLPQKLKHDPNSFIFFNKKTVIKILKKL